jgi:hypothetical protein
MGRDDKGNDRTDLAKWLVDTTPALAGLLATQGAQHLGADGFAASGLGLLVARIAASVSPAAQRRLQPFLLGWLGGAKTEDADGYWRRVAAAEAAQETVFVAVDRLRSVLDPAAARVLGRLTAEYVDADHFPDAFFRDFSRLLTEIQGEELDELGALCKKVETLALKSPSVRLDLSMREGGAGQVRFWQVTAGSGQVRQTSILGPDYDARDATRRMVLLLAATGMVQRTAQGEPMYVDLAVSDVERMSRLLVP